MDHSVSRVQQNLGPSHDLGGLSPGPSVEPPPGLELGTACSVWTDDFSGIVWTTMWTSEDAKNSRLNTVFCRADHRTGRREDGWLRRGATIQSTIRYCVGCASVRHPVDRVVRCNGNSVAGSRQTLWANSASYPQREQWRNSGPPDKYPSRALPPLYLPSK